MIKLNKQNHSYLCPLYPPYISDLHTNSQLREHNGYLIHLYAASGYMYTNNKVVMNISSHAR